jgi:hypothetical protein
MSLASPEMEAPIPDNQSFRQRGCDTASSISSSDSISIVLERMNCGVSKIEVLRGRHVHPRRRCRMTGLALRAKTSTSSPRTNGGAKSVGSIVLQLTPF